MLKVLSFPIRDHPSQDNAQSIKKPFNFLIDWVVINERLEMLLNFRLALETKLASVQTINFDNSKSLILLFLIGFKAISSFVFPGVVEYRHHS